MKNIEYDLLQNLDNATSSNRKVTRIGLFDVTNTDPEQVHDEAREPAGCLLPAQLADGMYESSAVTLCVHRSKKEAKKNLPQSKKCIPQGVPEMETTPKLSAISASNT